MNLDIAKQKYRKLNNHANLTRLTMATIAIMITRAQERKEQIGGKNF